jgi:hypothetical protein
MHSTARALVLATLTLSTVLADGPAIPCSLIGGPMPGALPVDGATTGPLPLIVSGFGSQPGLEKVGDPHQTFIPLVRDAEFVGFFVNGQLGAAWRPPTPLEAGEYLVLGALTDGGGDPFPTIFVDPTLVDTKPTLGPVELRARLEEDDGVGCNVNDGDCSGVDGTSLTLDLPVDTEPELFLLEVRNPKTNLRRVELVASPAFAGTTARTIFFLNNPQRFPGSLKSDRLCFTLTPISDEGVLGDLVDLGCIRPDDDDPRVNDTRGCSTGGTNHGTLALWLAALLATRALTRTRSPFAKAQTL